MRSFVSTLPDRTNKRRGLCEHATSDAQGSRGVHSIGFALCEMENKVHLNCKTIAITLWVTIGRREHSPRQADLSPEQFAASSAPGARSKLSQCIFIGVPA